MNVDSYENFAQSALESAKEKCRQTFGNAVGTKITIGVGVGSALGGAAGCSSGAEAKPMLSLTEIEFSKILDKDYNSFLNERGFEKKYLAHRSDKKYLIKLVEEAALALLEHFRKISFNSSVNSPED